VADTYYAFSSVFFYTGRSAFLIDGRYNNLEYGSYAPGAPDVFIDDQKFVSFWAQPRRYYLLTYATDMQHWVRLVGEANLHVVAKSAGKYLLTNLPSSVTAHPSEFGRLSNMPGQTESAVKVLGQGYIPSS